MTPHLTIVVPTFNEKDNIRPLVDLIAKAMADVPYEVIFVDDDSPDGTAEEVRAVGKAQPNIRVIHRVGRRGLSGACIEGILSSSAPISAVMDCDLQHDETRLPVMLEKLKSDPTLDLVIGSRNVDGGSTGDGLSRVRKWGSDVATNLTTKMLRITASDPMSGFFMVRRVRVNEIVTELQTEGFKILADMLSASRGHWNVAEVPFTFRKRLHGESKMDSAVALEFLGLLLARSTGGLISIRFVLFMLVGLSGVVVQLGVVTLMLAFFTDNFTIAQTAGVIVAMTTNFAFNNALTYHDRSLHGSAFLRGLLSFYAVCAIGALANIGVASALFEATHMPAISSFAGAVVGALWNFVASSLVTWRRA